MLSQPSPVSGLQNVQMLHCARQQYTHQRTSRAAGQILHQLAHEKHKDIPVRKTDPGAQMGPCDRHALLALT